MNGEELPLMARIKRLKSDRNNNGNDRLPVDDVMENPTGRRRTLLRRLPSFRSALTPNFGKWQRRVNSVSCLRKPKDDDDEDEPRDLKDIEIPRHRSIDITVGFARRASLFLFTRKTVCAHPYHPFTPKVTTRKIYIGLD